MSAVKPLLGMTAEPADTELMVATFPDILYMRRFGAKVGDQPGVRLRLPDEPGEVKWQCLPPNAIMHDSWKGDIEQLWAYLDRLTRPALLSPWHEPMDDVAAGRLTAADFRRMGERGAEIIAAHPNGHFVLGWGPILTRWWLEHGGNPDDYWFDGANMFCADSYNKLSTGYRTPEGMLATIAAIAAAYGVPWAVPELGAELIEGDDGTGRGAWLRGCAEWADQEGNCLAIGEWGLGGNRLIGHPIETAVWQELTAAQKGYDVATWRVAYGLDKLLAQINAMAPNRSKASDGSIGDPEHRERPSDHNPDAQGIVRARDFTHDPAAGADMDKISEALRVSRDRRIKYVIFNRRIFSGVAGPSPFTWRPYTGTNPHDKHMHVSTVADNAIADDTSEWEIGMAITSADVNMIWGNGWEIPGRTPGRTGAGTLEAMLVKLDSLLGSAAADVTRDQALQATLDAIAGAGTVVDTAVIKAHIDAKVGETNAAVEAMRAAHQIELDALQADLAAARETLARVPADVIAEIAS